MATSSFLAVLARKQSKESERWYPHLSYSSLRQRSLPSSGAVLDVAGGGQGEESQDAQGEHGARHRCWVRGASLTVISSACRLSDTRRGRFLTYKQMDVIWHKWLTHGSDVSVVPLRSARARQPQGHRACAREVAADVVLHQMRVI